MSAMSNHPLSCSPSLLRAGLLLLLFGGCDQAPLPMPMDTADGGTPAPPMDAGPIDGDGAMPAPDRDMAPPSPACSGKMSYQAGTTKQHMMSGGKDRSYLLHVPTGYDPAQPTQLVLAFHGLTDQAEDYLKYIRMEPESDRRRFLLLVPQGLGLLTGWNAGTCCEDPSIDDVGFVRDLLAQARKDFCIDDHRVYAEGFSNGAFFSNRLGCELSADFAAIGPVSGGLLISDCKISRPVSLMYFHGTADPTVPYGGSPVLKFPSAMTTWNGWAMRDGCTGTPKQTYQKGMVTCQTYGPCQEGSEATLCSIQGGVHAWPGSQGATMDIDATSALLDFFARHVRP